MKKTPTKKPKKPAKKTAKEFVPPIKQPMGFHWGIALLLGFIIGAGLLLYTAEVTTSTPTTSTRHPLDDDAMARIKAIETTYPKLAKPPREAWSNQPLTMTSMRYLLLLDSSYYEQQLVYFEQSIAAIIASQEKPKEIAAQPTVPAVSINVPILMYHRTPGDFDKQISHLVARGYTSIDFGQLVGAVRNRSALPAKPVIITLDDGYTDQLNSVAILRRYNMKATLYVINGGEASKWCIGAYAKSLPGCESYLNWDQIRELDRGGLITIGSHTINHPRLASLSADVQRAEILGGKQELEKQLGHAVYDFAYPYGSFNATSVQLAQQAGFRTAVTTRSGSNHTAGTLFMLTRLRDSLLLP